MSPDDVSVTERLSYRVLNFLTPSSNLSHICNKGVTNSEYFPICAVQVKVEL